MKPIIPLLCGTALLAGCATSVNVERLAPAKNDTAANTKIVAVTQFDNDFMGLSQKVESAITNKTVQGEPFFTVVSRRGINEVIDEQKLHFSNLVDNEGIIEAGKLIGAEGIISGAVNGSDTSYEGYYVSRIECADAKCKRTYERRIYCQEMNNYLSATINMTQVETGKLILSETFKAENQFDACRGSGLPTEAEAMDRLADDISEQFLSHIAPTAIAINVQLLDDPEIDYSDDQELQLERAIEYIKLQRYNRADELLSDLLTSTEDRCHVAAYNLGVVKEIKGENSKALQLYQLADRLSSEPEKLILRAITRVEKAIADSKRLEQQL